MLHTTRPVRSPWTRRLSLVAQPIWFPADSVCRWEILSRIAPVDPRWPLNPLVWWQLAATMGPGYVAHLDRWVWRTTQAQAVPGVLYHINLWPQTVLHAAEWMAQQPVAGLVLEVTEQLPWPSAVWDTLCRVWVARGGAVWLDDWADPDPCRP